MSAIESMSAARIGSGEEAHTAEMTTDDVMVVASVEDACGYFWGQGWLPYDSDSSFSCYRGAGDHSDLTVVYNPSTGYGWYYMNGVCTKTFRVRG